LAGIKARRILFADVAIAGLLTRDFEAAHGRQNSAIEAENSRAAAVDNCKNWDFAPSDWLHHAAHNRFARKASARQQFG
jgi:hypothetical protein